MLKATMRDRVHSWMGRRPGSASLSDSLERSPGARVLLQQAERSAQLALHVLRGLLWAAAVLAFVLALPGLSVASRLVAAILWVTVFGLLWIVIWRVLSGPRPPVWLRYALVYVDGAYLLELLLLARLPLPPLTLLPTASEVLRDVGIPLLVFLALSGVFRIDTLAAVLSAAAAILTYVILALALNIPPGQSLPTGLVIAFAGAAGVVGARVVRDAVLRAGEARILEHYVPGSLMGDLRRTGSGGNGREQQVTVLLTDIRGFTTLTESLPPAATVGFLNDYLSVAIPPLIAEGAVIDKYLGDGILAFIEGEQQAQRAVRAALALLHAVAALDPRSSHHGSIHVGVAVHTGWAMVGTIGPPERCEYTIISDTVNVTSRLEELNKRFASTMIISESVLTAGGELPNGFVGPEEVELRGHRGPLVVYYLPSGA